MSHAMVWEIHARLREWVHASSTCTVSLSWMQLSQVRVRMQVQEHAVQQAACGSAACGVSREMVLGTRSRWMWVWVCNARAWSSSWSLLSWVQA